MAGSGATPATSARYKPSKQRTTRPGNAAGDRQCAFVGDPELVGPHGLAAALEAHRVVDPVVDHRSREDAALARHAAGTVLEVAGPTGARQQHRGAVEGCGEGFIAGNAGNAGNAGWVDRVDRGLPCTGRGGGAWVRAERFEQPCRRAAHHRAQPHAGRGAARAG
ncbi:MAG: hypothetical protein U1F25_03160 [Rubrivivax sp.]